MPQTTYIPLFRASYPILAPAQKPGGVTVSTTLPGNATPKGVSGQSVAKNAKSKK